jgi:hypothetical protein
LPIFDGKLAKCSGSHTKKYSDFFYKGRLFLFRYVGHCVDLPNLTTVWSWIDTWAVRCLSSSTIGSSGNQECCEGAMYVWMSKVIMSRVILSKVILSKGILSKVIMSKLIMSMLIMPKLIMSKKYLKCRIHLTPAPAGVRWPLQVLGDSHVVLD